MASSSRLYNVARSMLNRTHLSKRSISVSSCSLVRGRKKTPLYLDPNQVVQQTITSDEVKEAAQPDPSEQEEIYIKPYSRKERFNQTLHHHFEDEDPSENTVIIFPGYGTHYVGMCSEMQKIKQIEYLFKDASEIVGYNLLDLCINGPIQKLNKIKYQETAIFVASVASLLKLQVTQPEVIENCVVTAGFSVGEITALYFSGALSFEDALRLVQLRGETIDMASQINSGGLLTVVLNHQSRLKYACEVAKKMSRLTVENNTHRNCQISTYLHPECKIVGGSLQALDFILENKEDFKLRSVKRVAIGAALHTSLMNPVMEPISEALENVFVRNPKIPVFSCRTAQIQETPGVIKNNIAKQLTKCVKWEQVLHAVYEREKGSSFPTTYECGPQNFLTSVLKNVNLKASNLSINVSA